MKPIAAMSALLVILPLLGCYDQNTNQNTNPAFAAPTLSPSSAPAVKIGQNDWPWWRGPTLNGKSSGKAPPTEWNQKKNVVWKSPIPGRGYSTPSILGNRIFISTADDEAQTQSLLCLDRKNGKQLWKKQIHKGKLPRAHRKNSHASASPACDGELIFVAFAVDDAIFVTAVDSDGNQKWQERVGSFKSEHGFCGSPVIYKSVVVVCGDSLQGSFISGIDRASGKSLWRTSRKDGPAHGNYAAPIVGVVAGRPQVLISGQLRVDSYDPMTGERLWTVDGTPAAVIANTMTFDGDYVYASGGYPEKATLCIRADGKGDVTETHIEWRRDQLITYVPSPIVHNGRIYMVNDGGIALCLNSKTGKEIWRDRIDGAFSASPILAGDYLFCPSEDGTTHILKIGNKFERVASNDLGSGIFASPVICGGQLFLRTKEHLYCIGKG